MHMETKLICNCTYSSFLCRPRGLRKCHGKQCFSEIENHNNLYEYYSCLKVTSKTKCLLQICRKKRKKCNVVVSLYKPTYSHGFEQSAHVNDPSLNFCSISMAHVSKDKYKSI